MTDLGFGHTKKMLKSLKDREDFEDSLVYTIGKKKVEESKDKEVVINEDDYFDPVADESIIK